MTGFSSVGSVVGNAVVVGAVPGIGTGERLFPPQAGLTFTSWVCVDRFSSSTDDPHPVRLLTVARHFRSGDGKVQMSPCLSITLSAKDKMLVVSKVILIYYELQSKGILCPYFLWGIIDTDYVNNLLNVLFVLANVNPKYLLKTIFQICSNLFLM